MRLGRN